MYIAIKIFNNFLSVDDKNIIVYTNIPDYNWTYEYNKLYYKNLEIIWFENCFKIKLFENTSTNFFIENNQLFFYLNNKKMYLESINILPTITENYNKNCFCEIYKYYSKLGICHWASLNKFNNSDLLIKGTDDAKKINCNHIKLYIGRKSKESYNIDININSNLNEIVSHPSYKYAISKFDTIVFVAFSTFKEDDNYWKYSFSNEDEIKEYIEFSNFTKYLIETYPNKNFIIQNWESDWCIKDNDNKYYIQNMIKWLNARGKGVMSNNIIYNIIHNIKKVKYAIEVNQVLKTFNEPSALTLLLPYVKVDCISYSAYDSQFSYFEDSIDLIKKYCDDVYIGEFGIDQLSYSKEIVEKLIDNVFHIASKKKCSFIFIWQLYNNEKDKMFGLYDDCNILTNSGIHFNKYLNTIS